MFSFESSEINHVDHLIQQSCEQNPGNILKHSFLLDFIKFSVGYKPSRTSRPGGKRGGAEVYFSRLSNSRSFVFG